MIPQGAQKIIDIRGKGFKPNEMILVSFIGRIDEPNYTIYAAPNRDYDWSWVRDLQVCIYAASGIEWAKAALAIALAKPSYLGVWDAGRREGAELWAEIPAIDIDKPKIQWRRVLAYMPWTNGQNRRFECS